MQNLHHPINSKTFVITIRCRISIAAIQKQKRKPSLKMNVVTFFIIAFKASLFIITIITSNLELEPLL